MRYRIEIFGDQIKATKESLLIAYMRFGIRKKVTFINEQNWRNTVRAVAPVYSGNQDLHYFCIFGAFWRAFLVRRKKEVSKSINYRFLQKRAIARRHFSHFIVIPGLQSSSL